MKKLFYLILIIGATISLWSCKDAKESEKKADEFYGFLIDEDYDAVVNLISDKALEVDDEDVWISLFKQRTKSIGAPIEWKKTYTGFETNEIGKITELRFEVKNENKTTYETLKFYEEGGDIKILSYVFTVNSDYKTMEGDLSDIEIPVFQTEETTVEKFYLQYDKNDFSTIAEILTKKNAKPEDVEVFINQLKEKFNHYGKIKKIEKTDAYEYGEKNDKGIAIFYKITYENGEVSFEKFEFSAVDEIGLIQYYNWAEDPEKL
jgi:hypothetical protein